MLFLYSKIPLRLSFFSLQNVLHFIYPYLYFMLFDSRFLIVPKINLSNDELYALISQKLFLHKGMKYAPSLTIKIRPKDKDFELNLSKQCTFPDMWNTMIRIF